jgi:hypothetical protein
MVCGVVLCVLGSSRQVGVVVSDRGVVDSRNTNGVCSVELSACTKGEVVVVKGNDVGYTKVDDVEDVTKDAFKVEEVEWCVGVTRRVGFSRVDYGVTHRAEGCSKGVECRLVVMEETSHRTRDVDG